MRRRKFLQTISTATVLSLTGCFQESQTENNVKSTATKSDNSTPTVEAEPVKYSVSSVGIQSEENTSLPFKYSAELQYNELHSKQSPLRMTIYLKNIGSQTYQYFEPEQAFFIGQLSQKENLKVFSVDTEKKEGESTNSTSNPPSFKYDGCWRRKSQLESSERMKIESIHPSEVHKREILISTADSMVCSKPPDTIQFNTELFYGMPMSDTALKLEPSLVLAKLGKKKL